MNEKERRDRTLRIFALYGNEGTKSRPSPFVDARVGSKSRTSPKVNPMNPLDLRDKMSYPFSPQG